MKLKGRHLHISVNIFRMLVPSKQSYGVYRVYGRIPQLGSSYIWYTIIPGTPQVVGLLWKGLWDTWYICRCREARKRLASCIEESCISEASILLGNLIRLLM